MTPYGTSDYKSHSHSTKNQRTDPPVRAVNDTSVGFIDEVLEGTNETDGVEVDDEEATVWISTAGEAETVPGDAETTLEEASSEKATGEEIEYASETDAGGIDEEEATYETSTRGEEVLGDEIHDGAHHEEEEEEKGEEDRVNPEGQLGLVEEGQSSKGLLRISFSIKFGTLLTLVSLSVLYIS